MYTDYNPLEALVVDNGHLSLANLMRTLRLFNPYEEDTPQYEIWRDEGQFNIPLLIMGSLYINDFCKIHGKKRILFTARDCGHWIQIFKKLYPDYESIYFYSSRYIYQHPSVKYIEYVRQLYSHDAVIVDTQGSGGSCINFFISYLNTLPTFISIIRGSGPYQYKGISLCVDVSAETMILLDMFNYQFQGSLVGYTKDGPQFLPLEYNLEYVYPAHACVKKCLEIISQYQIEGYNSDLLKAFAMGMHFKSTIAKYLEHVHYHGPKKQ